MRKLNSPSVASPGSLALLFLAGCRSAAATDSGADVVDIASSDSSASDVSTDALPATLPALGVYEANVDGTGLRLLLDTGTRQITHVRRQPGTDWLTGTRYTVDADGNGLAMEIENPFGAYYAGAEVIVLRESDPGNVAVIAGGVAGKLCANSSWTDDGNLIFIQQDHPTNPDWTRLKRAHFGPVPTVTIIDAVPVPATLLLPTDPHQTGPSDANGTLVFPAVSRDANGWSHGVWLMPASGTTSIAQVSLIGCPLCAGVCCGWPNLADVLGATDPRMNHAGTQVIWMQQSPSVSFGSPPVHPFRQAGRMLPSGTQIDIPSAGIAATTSETFIEWRDDDGEGVYWSIELEAGVLRQNLYRMHPDGTARERIPVPHELCAFHPSYLDATHIAFTAWRCAGADCSCDVRML